MEIIMLKGPTRQKTGFTIYIIFCTYWSPINIYYTGRKSSKRRYFFIRTVNFSTNIYVITFIQFIGFGRLNERNQTQDKFDTIR